MDVSKIVVVKQLYYNQPGLTLRAQGVSDYMEHWGGVPIGTPPWKMLYRVSVPILFHTVNGTYI